MKIIGQLRQSVRSHPTNAFLSSFNYGGLNLAVFRQFRHIYTRHYLYPPQYNSS